VSYSFPDWLLLIASGFVIGASKVGLIGAAILAVPFMAMVFPAKESTGALLPLLCFADVIAVILYRYHAQWKELGRMLPPAAAGIVAGFLLMGRITDAQLKPVIGVIVLVLLVLNAVLKARGKGAVTAHPVAAVVLGLLAGITTMLANASGPIMILYFLALGFEKEKFVGTIAWFYFIINLVKVPFSAYLGLVTVKSLGLNLVLAPTIVAGAAFGFYFVKKVPQKPFEVLTQLLAAAGAINLLF